jgi:hypothetical protein
MQQYPDDQTVLDRGFDSEQLLQSAVFVSAMNDSANFHLTALVAAPEGPEGLSARDHHHRMLHAHREVEAQLRLYVQAALETSARITAAKALSADTSLDDNEETEL